MPRTENTQEESVKSVRDLKRETSETRDEGQLGLPSSDRAGMKAHDAQKGKRCSSIACLDKARQDLHRQVLYERVGPGEREKCDCEGASTCA